MHIKKIVIQGFKTYKNTTVIEDLSPNHNVVVGRNGSGKSNFFAAIRFVLSDQYTRMSKEERQGLIHEGSGTVLSAYVEIVFDNSDGRFPTGKSEVVIRRTIGLKKDDYSLDYKSSTRTDIMQLLESAGFSKSNPYYIVPQGRITSLTNAKDSERLNLLKEVAGAQVFESKLRESNKEMEKTKSQKDKIDEMLGFIDGRLRDLDSEKDELRKFQKYEKEKKIFEFILYDRELNEITNAIDEIDREYQTSVEDSQGFVKELDARESKVGELGKSISALQKEIKLAHIDKNQLERSYNDLSRSIFDLQAQLDEQRAAYDASRDLSSRHQKQLASLREQIARKEQQVQQKTPALQALQAREAELKHELSLLRTRQSLLYSRQGHYAQFGTVEERNAWIAEQIAANESVQRAAQGEVGELTRAQAELEARLEAAEAQIGSLQDAISGETAQRELSSLETRLGELKAQYAGEIDARRVLWRDESRLRSVLGSLQQELDLAQRQLNQTMDKQQSSGLQAVERIARALHVSERIYGPVGELITVNDKYKAAVESVAGNALFHVVVDTDDTASVLMEELSRQKAGRVTFMPLNRLEPKQVVYPEAEDDSVPLIKKISFDPRVERAVKHVFGQTIVVVDLERGVQLAKQYKLGAITLDGDRADKRGLLTGGYHDYYKKSRVEAMRQKKALGKRLAEQQHRLAQIAREIASKDQEITRISSDISRTTTQLDALHTAKKSLKVKLSDVLEDRLQLRDEAKFLQHQLSAKQRTIDNVQLKVDELAKELRSAEFQQGLAPAEQHELAVLTAEISAKEAQYHEVSDALFELQNELASLEIELAESLQPRLHELNRQASLVQQPRDLDGAITSLADKIETLTQDQDSVKRLLDESQELLEAKGAELKHAEKALAAADEHQRKLLRKLENFQKNSDKYLSRRSVMLTRRDEAQRRIRELGALPEEAFSSYQDLSSEALLKKITKVTRHLDAFQHVNKKALDQYLSFTKQRDSLVERRAELDKSEESVFELIKVLKSRKNEAIQKTFDQVSAEFTKVFEKLVPKGVGRLIIETKSAQHDDQDQDEDVEMADASSSIIDTYSGVSIKVSFNSKRDEQLYIEQLSGGQKSLCAIALILAIQKSDPAPFYLFDEIDANLDTQYRTAVASLIHELSANAQFICTTFRPEMLHVANKFFGVMFSNKISTIHEIDKNDALGFVEGQQQQQ